MAQFEKLTAPSQGTPIRFENGQPVVADNPIIPFIRGDGTGVDIWPATQKVLDAAVAKAYGGSKSIEWFKVYAGDEACDLYGTYQYLPQDTLTAIEQYGVAIKGPLITPIGGGIRSAETIEHYLSAGVSYVIIGTKAVKEPEFVGEMCRAFPGHIIVGLDAKDGYVATDGWAEVSTVKATELAKRFANDGVSSIVYTDIARDGMMQGVNVEATAALAREGGLPVIASGGVTNLDDIRALCDVADSGILGAITGRAIYEGSLDVAEAQRLSDQLSGGSE